MHHAIVIQIEGASYRLRAHSDLIRKEALKSLNTTVAQNKTWQTTKNPRGLDL